MGYDKHKYTRNDTVITPINKNSANAGTLDYSDHHQSCNSQLKGTDR